MQGVPADTGMSAELFTDDITPERLGITGPRDAGLAVFHVKRLGCPFVARELDAAERLRAPYRAVPSLAAPDTRIGPARPATGRTAPLTRH